MIKLLKLLEPFGCGNPKPLFITKARAMNFSRIGNYTHIKNKMKNFKFIAFNGEYALPLLNGNTEKIISFGMDRDIFRNKEYIQCVIKDIYADKAHVDEDILFARYLSAFTHQGKRKDIIKKLLWKGTASEIFMSPLQIRRSMLSITIAMKGLFSTLLP